MPIKHTSQEIIQKLNAREIKVFKGLTERLDIIFTSDNGDTLEEFVTFINEVNVRHVFIDVHTVTEEDIEDSLVTDQMLDKKSFHVPKAYLDTVKKDVNAYNNKQRKLKQHIGKEQRVKVFFAYQGTIFCFVVYDYDLYPDDPEEFLEDLFDEHEDTISEIREKEAEVRHQARQKKLDDLEKELLSSEGFRKCTNVQLRKEFVMGLAVEKGDGYLYGADGIRQTHIFELAEKAWRTLKYKSVKTSNVVAEPARPQGSTERF